MYQTSERLPHLLPPAAYFAMDVWHRECQAIFASTWHFVGVTSELATQGAFIALDVLGMPVQVRHFDHGLGAVGNVCAHRHALLTSERRGCSAALRCQYHGWEYDATGRTRKIPAPKNFVPMDRDALRLPTYPVETCGQLVFVRLTAEGPTLREFLGERFAQLAERFGEGWRATLVRDIEQPVNWKVPVENTLEAYHVDAVHAGTFRKDPGEERSTHQFFANGSAFTTTLPFDPSSRVDLVFQQQESRFVRNWLRETPTARYEQIHIFPNLLVSLTDMLSLIHVVQPRNALQSVSLVRQFGRVRGSSVTRWLCRRWGQVAAGITERILHEDFALYPAIQQGLERSTHAGVLGRCEERIHAFQAWTADRVASPAPT